MEVKMSPTSFDIDLAFLYESAPLGVGQLLVPPGFTFVANNKSLEVFEVKSNGQREIAGNISLNGSKVQLELRSTDAGNNLLNAWYDRFPLLNPDRLVWRLFIPGIYNRKMMGFIPDNKIGQCETFEELDIKMGDTLFPDGTIAGQYQSSNLVATGGAYYDSYLHLFETSIINKTGGLGAIIELSNTEMFMIRITNPHGWWDKDR
jgi:hypothetical protein